MMIILLIIEIYSNIVFVEVVVGLFLFCYLVGEYYIFFVCLLEIIFFNLVIGFDLCIIIKFMVVSFCKY